MGSIGSGNVSVSGGPLESAPLDIAFTGSLGFTNVRVYDSSWLGYGNQLDAPADSVSYFNVARVNNMLNQLQGRIDDLEAQLSEVRKAKAGCRDC